MENKQAYWATVLGLAALLCWSASIGLIRSITESVGALAGGALIYSSSGLLIMIVRGLPKWRSLSPLYLYGCGSLFIAYEILLSQSIGMAMNRTQSIQVSLMNYAWPCLTLVFAIIFKLQRSSWGLWIGAGIAFAGIIYAVSSENSEQAVSFWLNVQQNPWSYLFAGLAAVIWALYCNLTRIYGQGQDATVFFLIFTGGILWLNYFIYDAPAIELNSTLLFELAAIASATALGYSFWNYAIQRGNMMLLAVASYFTPLLSMLFASWWLATTLTWSFWQGVMMVLAGSLICWRASLPSRITAKPTSAKA